MNYQDFFSQALNKLQNSPTKDTNPLGEKAPIEAIANTLTGDFA